MIPRPSRGTNPEGGFADRFAGIRHYLLQCERAVAAVHASWEMIPLTVAEKRQETYFRHRLPKSFVGLFTSTIQPDPGHILFQLSFSIGMYTLLA